MNDDGKLTPQAIARQVKAEGVRRVVVVTDDTELDIGPGEEIEVEIQYQQTLRYDQGRYSLRFPMVVGPRFVPAGIIAVNRAQEYGYTLLSTL